MLLIPALFESPSENGMADVLQRLNPLAVLDPIPLWLMPLLRPHQRSRLF